MQWVEDIVTYINSKVPHLKTCRAYSGEFDNAEIAKVGFNTPAVFVTCLGWVKAKTQPGSGVVAYTARFAAFMINETSNKHNTDIVALSMAVTEAIEGSTCGVKDARAAVVERCENGTKSTKKKGLSLWALTWHQDIYVGESQWCDGDVLPTSLHYSVKPITGLANKDQYQKQEITHES